MDLKLAGPSQRVQSMEVEAFAEPKLDFEELGCHTFHIADFGTAKVDKLGGKEPQLELDLQMEHFRPGPDLDQTEIVDRTTAFAFHRKAILAAFPSTELVQAPFAVLLGRWATSLATFDCIDLQKACSVYRRQFD